MLGRPQHPHRGMFFGGLSWARRLHNQGPKSEDTQNYPKLQASLGTQPESGHNTYDDSAFFQGKGDWNEATFKKNQEVMANLWNEIADLADFNKVN